MEGARGGGNSQINRLAAKFDYLRMDVQAVAREVMECANNAFIASKQIDKAVWPLIPEHLRAEYLAAARARNEQVFKAHEKAARLATLAREAKA